MASENEVALCSLKRKSDTSETCCLSEDTSFEILEHNKKHYCPCDFEPGVVLSPLYDWFNQFSALLWGMCYSAILTVGEKYDT